MVILTWAVLLVSNKLYSLKAVLRAVLHDEIHVECWYGLAQSEHSENNSDTDVSENIQCNKINSYKFI